MFRIRLVIRESVAGKIHHRREHVVLHQTDGGRSPNHRLVFFLVLFLKLLYVQFRNCLGSISVDDFAEHEG